MPDPGLMPTPSPRPLTWPPLIARLQAVLVNESAPVYLVGGIVRDAFWGRPAHDIDLAVAAHGFRVARRIANALGGGFYRLDPERETGRAIVEFDGRRWIVDVANFRGGDLLADLQGRDFTLNAVAVALQSDLQQVIDPLHGLADAQARVLRRCGPEAIASDPIRALRAVRQSVRFKLRIEPATRDDLKRYGPQIRHTSPERLRDEFMALLAGPRPAAALRTLDALSLLSLIVPEIEPLRGLAQSAPHQNDVWQHTLATVEKLYGVVQTISPQRSDNTAAQAGLGMIVYYLDRFRADLNAHLTQSWPQERPHSALLMLAALLHDSGKPQSRQEEAGHIRFLGHEAVSASLAEARGRALILSNGEVTRLKQIVGQHMRPLLLHREAQITRRAVYRFWRDCGPAGLDVCVLALADYLATAGTALSTKEWSTFLQSIGTLLEGYLTPEARVVDLPPLVTGNDLMAALNLGPGPRLGELLALLQEAQAVGEITSADDALALARTYVNGRNP